MRARVMYLNVIEESSWSCNKNVYTFSYSEKKNNNKTTKNELNKKFTARIHFFSKRLSPNSLSCTRQGKWGRRPDLLQLVPHIFHAGSATLKYVGHLYSQTLIN